MRKQILFFILVLSACVSFGQNRSTENDLVQFSGVVVNDSLLPVPFASIMIRNTNRGTVSDYYGFFSFVAKMGDTVEFAAIGFKKGSVTIPDTLSDNRCSMIQVLKRDTIILREVMIFPWPTKEQFKEAFLQLRIPDDDLSRAEKNLQQEQLNFLFSNMPMDGSMNFKNYLDANQTRLYYNGQLPANNLLNPVAWAKFIQSWQSGVYKKKDKK